ncbi:MAG: substrate-binding domain-containing protein [Oscillospiraceae bacterium]|nr:substrate-binding domain-containing protein [Oscillospiraceae bacterium]
MKKLIALLLAVLMVVGLMACAKDEPAANDPQTDAPAPSTDDAAEPAEEPKDDEPAEPAEPTGSDAKKTIYVLTPNPDHGWTGAIGVFAQEKVDAVNTDGAYNAVLLTSASADEQIAQIEDIVANDPGDGSIAVAMLPQGEAVENAIQQLIDAGIPYTAADRIIASVADAAVSNIKYDNNEIGAAAAYYMVSNGMKEGDKCVVFEGDGSSADTDRTDGFNMYLKGEYEYNGEKIAEPWSDLSSITYSGSLGWSQANCQAFFETYMSDASNADTKYLAGWDDGYVLGTLDALEGSAIDESIKETFLANAPYLTGCGGPEAVYAILRGDSTSYTDITPSFGGIMSVTYPPAMIQDTIQAMIDYLDGKDVLHDNTQSAQCVTSDNVANFVGFE